MFPSISTIVLEEHAEYVSGLLEEYRDTQEDKFGSHINIKRQLTIYKCGCVSVCCGFFGWGFPPKLVMR